MRLTSGAVWAALPAVWPTDRSTCSCQKSESGPGGPAEPHLTLIGCPRSSRGPQRSSAHVPGWEWAGGGGSRPWRPRRGRAPLGADCSW